MSDAFQPSEDDHRELIRNHREFIRSETAEFIQNWKTEHGIDLRSTLTYNQALACHDDWMNSDFWKKNICLRN
jgi:hypothetical protein